MPRANCTVKREPFKSEPSERLDCFVHERDGAYGKLDEISKLSTSPYETATGLPTRHHVPGIQRVVVLNEAKSIHKLHLGDSAGAILGKMGLDIFLRN